MNGVLQTYSTGMPCVFDDEGLLADAGLLAAGRR